MNTNGTNIINVFTENEIPLFKRLYKSEIEKYLEISHFSVILITPNKDAYITSASKNFTDQYKHLGLHKYDNTMSDLMYDNLDFYTWADGYVKVYQDEIKKVKQSFGLNNGTVFVRKIGEYTLLYCVATKKEDPIMKTLFVNHANSILQIGDYMYNEIKHSLEEFTQGLYLPTIKNFQPFLSREIPCLAAYEKNRKENISTIIKNSKRINNVKLVLIKGGKNE